MDERPRYFKAVITYVYHYEATNLEQAKFAASIMNHTPDEKLIEVKECDDEGNIL